jgi:hypothetical protein
MNWAVLIKTEKPVGTPDKYETKIVDTWGKVNRIVKGTLRPDSKEKVMRIWNKS